MKKDLKCQSVVSYLLLFVLIISTSGCYSLKDLKQKDIQTANKSVCFVHGPESFYKLTNTKITDGFLTGNIDNLLSPAEKAKTIHIYAAPDSVIKKTGDIVRVPVSGIAKVEVYEINGVRTLIGCIGTFSIIFLIWIVIVILS